MKRYLLGFLFLAPLLAKSQSATFTSYNYSLGIKAFSIEQFPKILNDQNATRFRSSALNGLIFKINNNQISHRFLGSFYSDNISFDNECEGCERLNGRMRDYALKIGFEKNINYSVVQPYYGVDLGYKRNEFKGDTYQIRPGGTLYTAKTEKNGASISPLFGVKFNLIDHLSLAAESTIDILYSYERQEKTFHDEGLTNTVQRYNKWEFLMKPVGFLSLQFNFAQTD